MSEQPKCELCGEPMPAGEEMFKYHGYSGPCPGANWDAPLTPKEQELIDKSWATYNAPVVSPGALRARIEQLPTWHCEGGECVKRSDVLALLGAAPAQEKP